jgi:glycosyltransferase involved in cell wall biosynthesis
MLPPKVSILIPTYNQPDYLRNALDSIVCQTYKNFEVIITDDSEDTVIKSVVDEFSTKLDIKYFKNPVRKGSPGNWNEAISKSSGHYIKFLHHDDWFTNKDSLQEYVHALDNIPHANFAFSCTNICDINHNIIRTHCPTERELIKLRKNSINLFPHNFVGAPSATIYRRNVNKLFDNRLKWVVDIDFYINILKEDPMFVFIPKNAISCMDGAPGQITLECQNNKSIELFEWIYLFNKIDNSAIPKFSHIFFIWRILLKYNVISIKEIREYGISSIPAWINILVVLNRILIPFMRIFKKLKHKR